MPEKSLAYLEATILKAVARLERLNSENAQLRKEIQGLKHLLEELRIGNQQQQERIGQLTDERRQMRDRLKRMKEYLAVLEGPVSGPSS